MPNPIQHFEFWSEDPARLAEFYSRALSWKVNALPEIDYHLVDTDSNGEGIGGGIMNPQRKDWPTKTTFYISVEDLPTARQRVVEAGGKLIVEHQVVPNVGEFCLFEDPDGRVLGLWQEANHG